MDGAGPNYGEASREIASQATGGHRRLGGDAASLILPAGAVGGSGSEIRTVLEALEAKTASLKQVLTFEEDYEDRLAPLPQGTSPHENSALAERVLEDRRPQIAWVTVRSYRFNTDAPVAEGTLLIGSERGNKTQFVWCGADAERGQSSKQTIKEMLDKPAKIRGTLTTASLEMQASLVPQRTQLILTPSQPKPKRPALLAPTGSFGD